MSLSLKRKSNAYRTKDTKRKPEQDQVLGYYVNIEDLEAIFSQEKSPRIIEISDVIFVLGSIKSFCRTNNLCAATDEYQFIRNVFNIFSMLFAVSHQDVVTKIEISIIDELEIVVYVSPEFLPFVDLKCVVYQAVPTIKTSLSIQINSFIKEHFGPFVKLTFLSL
jgi:hypothetical protein